MARTTIRISLTASILTLVAGLSLAILAGRFAAAIDDLAGLGSARASDTSVVRLRAACEDAIASPPPADWDGVARLAQK